MLSAPLKRALALRFRCLVCVSSLYWFEYSCYIGEIYIYIYISKVRGLVGTFSSSATELPRNRPAGSQRWFAECRPGEKCFELQTWMKPRAQQTEPRLIRVPVFQGRRCDGRAKQRELAASVGALGRQLKWQAPDLRWCGHCLGCGVGFRLGLLSFGGWALVISRVLH